MAKGIGTFTVTTTHAKTGAQTTDNFPTLRKAQSWAAGLEGSDWICRITTPNADGDMLELCPKCNIWVKSEMDMHLLAYCPMR